MAERSCDERGGGEENGREAAGVAPKMADQIPLHPVPRSTQRRAAYYTSAATAQRHNRYEQGRHGGFLLFLPPIVSNGGQGGLCPSPSPVALWGFGTAYLVRGEAPL